MTRLPWIVRTVLAVLLLLYAVPVTGALGFDLFGWLGRDPQSLRRGNAADAPASVPVTAATPDWPPGVTPNYRAIVRDAGPAVVGITVTGAHPALSGERPPGLEDDPFLQFFRGLPGFQGRTPGGETPFRSQGSGFIISQDGLVLAIGSPFGFEQSATQGIVSAKGRSPPGETAVPSIQTDVAVNPGNSGGPLFDATGAVVGINAQIYPRSGGYQGLSFAIPINVALKVKDQILATGRATHARLGVVVQDLDQALAESFGLDRPAGALLVRVASGSAAADAGLRPGDIVLAVNGVAVRTVAQMHALLDSKPPQVAPLVDRNGHRLYVAVRTD